MVLKANWANGEDYTATAVNDVATQINTNTTAMTTLCPGSAAGTPTALTIWKGTQAQYNALSPTYNANTIYCVTA